jgi:hypothetical protein
MLSIGADQNVILHRYNASASSSEKPFPGSKNVTFDTSSASGSLIKEDCGLHEANGTTWEYPNQTRKIPKIKF